MFLTDVSTDDYYLKLTFSHRGSISVNKSLLFAFDFNTSAPPALPNIISPACFDAVMATERSKSSVSSEGSSMLLDDVIDDLAVDDLKVLGVANENESTTDTKAARENTISKRSSGQGFGAAISTAQVPRRRY